MAVVTRTDKLNQLILEGCLSFKHFAENIVREMDGFKINVPWFQEEWVYMADKHQKIVIEASRGSGKTATMCILYPLWKTFYGKDLTFLIVAPTEDRAYKILQGIRYLIETNPLLKNLKPEPGEGTWTKTELTTSNNCKFYIKPMNQNVRGYHVNYLLVEEAGQITDMETFFSVVIPTAFTKKGKCVAIGTPETYYDLIAKLKDNQQFKAFRYPAIGDNITTYENQILWKERFSITDLKKVKREIGKVRFDREFLLNIRSKGSQVFTEDMILPCRDDTRRFMEFGNTQGNYYFGIDLAWSSGKKGDYTVITILEQVGTSDEYNVVNITRLPRGLPTPLQEDEICKLCDRFNPRRIFMDKSGVGVVIMDSMKKKGYPISGFDFTAGKRGNIMFSVQHALGNRKLNIPYHESIRHTVDELFHEMTNIEFADGKYTTLARHDDMIISLCLALQAAIKYKTYISYAVSSESSSIYNKEYNYGTNRSFIKSYKDHLDKLKGVRLRV